MEDKSTTPAPQPEPGVLNLDDLFGTSRPIKVRLDQGDYELVRPESFGPRQTVRLNFLRRTAARLQAQEDLTQEQEKQLLAVLDETMILLCADLPVAEMTYPQKLQVLTFYAIQTAPKNVWKAALRSSGEPPSAG